MDGYRVLPSIAEADSPQSHLRRIIAACQPLPGLDGKGQRE
jgi:hypothetical protein